ncbi:tol-pal system-associated acyl-CoA thioesterase [Vibrio sp. ZSDZ34]|uniref:Tol-pal system-associated acyl-CoA thioesterase n=1 Tax=Vibrio gelatinilyticus TaxID=2893468 RepID=A0A9X1WET2_9VIBR|nr:tol-pal system-associated acyl-CoA thioesterase [Vibrio gelatinilyticus]
MSCVLPHQGLPFELSVTVYYEDTDAGGVVYHSNYLKFFERARTELLRTLGINQGVLLQEHVGFVVRHMDIDFLQGAKLDDHLTVQTTVAELKRASIVFDQKIVNAEGVVFSKALVKVACIDNAKMKPKPIPSFIVQELKSSEC